MAKKKKTSGPFAPGLHGSPAVAVAEKEESSIYEPGYSARRWWLLGIKIDTERNIVPFHNSAFGGIPWQQGTQNQVIEDGWLTLDQHRLRLTRQQLYASQVCRAASEIRQKVVRWIARPRDRWAADVLSLEHRVKTYDKKKEIFVPAGYRYQPGANDEPISKYLVFIPRSMVEQFSSGGKLFQPDLTSIPTMLDLDSSLIPDRMSRKPEGIAAEDEPW